MSTREQVMAALGSTTPTAQDQLELLMAQLLALDATLHATLRGVEGLLRAQEGAEHVPGGDARDDPESPPCAHLGATRVVVMGEGPGQLVCPNCGPVDG